MRIDDERRFGVFEYLNGQLSAHGRKVIEEDVQRVPCLKVLEEDANRNSRADEHGGAPEDLGVGDDAW
jgi:hypothetical protein